MARVLLENLNYSYDKQRYVLRDVTIDMEQEGRYSLLGPSGCGKTTLLKIIAGVLDDYEGEVYFNGKDMRGVPIEKRDIAMVFQSPVVYPMSVHDNLMFPLRRERLTKKESEKRINYVADMLDLTDVLDAQAHKLSPADEQTVALARSLIKDASIILLDEPLTSIETEKRVDVREKISRIQEEQEKIFIYVTHDQTEALTLSDKIGVMRDGRLLQFGTNEDIYYRPEHTFVGYFMGSPGMNILSGRVEGNTVDLEDFTLKLPAEYHGKVNEGAKVNVGVRPEFPVVSKEQKPDTVKFHCKDVQEKGEGVSILHVASVGGKQELRLSGNFRGIMAEHDIFVQFPEDRLHIYDPEDGTIIT
jgi:glycerol transport system ATP-binding protein